MVLAVPHVPAAEPAPSQPPRAARAPRLLLGALAVLLVLAAFAQGGAGVPEESRLQLALLVIAGLTAAAWLYGGELAFSAPRAAWIGVGLLAAFAVWCGVSIAWSVAPDRSWLAANRAIAAVVAVVLGLGVGSSLPRPHARAGVALVLAVGIVAIRALAEGDVSRLGAPVGSAEALGLLVALAVGPCLALALDRERPVGLRLAALAGTTVLLLVLSLTSSGAAWVALAAALAVVLVLGREGARILAWLAAAGLAAAAPILVAGRPEDDPLLVLGVLLVALGGLLLLGRVLVALERRGAFTPARDRRALLGVAAAAAVGLLVALAAVAVADGGLSGAADDVRAGDRWGWWQAAVGAWSDRPVAGWGAGSFPVAHDLYRAEPIDVRHPQSMPLQWLAETGLVGAGLALGGLLALVAAAVGRVRRLEAGRIAAAALAAAGVAWLAHASVDRDWDVPATTLALLLALGVACSRPALPAPRSPAARGLGLGALLAGLLLAAVLAALPALADSRTERALVLAAGPAEDQTPDRLADAAAQAELGARLFPVSVEPFFAAASIAQRIGELGQARRQLLRAIDRQPESSEAWARLVRVDLARGDRPAVERDVRRLVALDPRDPGVLRLAGRAQAALTPPEGSASATGSPLPMRVPAEPPALTP